jgi:hypothetical protein
MNRIPLTLLPLPVLAVLVAVSACSKTRTEETSHVIPPAASLLAPAAAAQTPPPPADVVAARADDEKPTADDVKEFERKVEK